MKDELLVGLTCAAGRSTVEESEMAFPRSQLLEYRVRSEEFCRRERLLLGRKIRLHSNFGRDSLWDGG